MDPNEALRNIRSFVASLIENIDENIDEDGEVDVDDVSFLCESIQGLDNWITSGGFLPKDWKHG